MQHGHLVKPLWSGMPNRPGDTSLSIALAKLAVIWALATSDERILVSE